MVDSEFEKREKAIAQRMAEVAERYQVEREKRLRAEGLGQYQAVTGDLAAFDEDPYVEPGYSRPAQTREVEALIIGGGFAGMLSAAHLRKAGIDDLLVLERGADFGGTWYWNRYPGAACDVESYIYLPLLEEVGGIPSEKYAKASEILRYSQRFANHFGLYERSLLRTGLTGLDWDDASSRWIAATDRGDRITAQFVVVAGGLLQRPKLPGIPGILDFKGHSFHTSRWDYAYTGGDSRGGMTGLRGKRVAVIGTGATAIQCVPFLAEDAEHLYVFQRTPASVFRRDNRPTDPEWAKSLEPGWQKRRMDNFVALSAGLPEPEDMVGDEFTNWAFGPVLDADPELAGLEGLQRFQRAMFLRMERCRARVDSIVKDPQVAEALKPQYGYFCKRPGFHDGFLDTFNRSNVSLVDTQGRGVERITANGIVADGVEYPVDLIIYATGFDISGDEQNRLGVEIHGRHGRSLNDKFAEGPATFHGLHTRDFPNLFRISIVQSGVTLNYTHVVAGIAEHIGYLIKTAKARGIDVVEASEQAEKAWVAKIVELAAPVMELSKTCTPSYFNREGEISDRRLRSSPYGDATGGRNYLLELEAWREQDDLAGLDITPMSPR